MKYNHEWLLELKAKITAIKNTVPTYHIGADDPLQIIDAKTRLWQLQSDAENLFGIIYNLAEEAYEREYAMADAAGDRQDAADHAREREEDR